MSAHKHDHEGRVVLKVPVFNDTGLLGFHSDGLGFFGFGFSF